jgi:hypothetical protein
MNRIHTISLALVALLSAALVPACVAEPGGSQDAEDGDDTREEVGTAEQALSTYTLDTATVHPTLADGDAPDEWFGCNGFPNGVVRSWQLKEKNVKDFRISRQWCRDMLTDGTLGPDNDPVEHFYHDGNGTLGMSSIPLDRLPVGVRIQADKSFGVLKVADVAMLSASAADIAAKRSSYAQAAYALSRNASTYTVMCPAGYVMTGIGVNTHLGSESHEIRGVGLACKSLVAQ